LCLRRFQSARRFWPVCWPVYEHSLGTLHELPSPGGHQQPGTGYKPCTRLRLLRWLKNSMPVFRQASSLTIVFVFAVISSAGQTAAPAQNPSATVQVSSTSDDPHALYLALQALRLDSQRVYPVHDVHFRRGPIALTLSQGRLAFYATVRGRITGAVFTGAGRVTMLPRQPAEKLSLLHFTGVPLLDQSFSQAYLRFTDDTAADLERQLMEQGVSAAPDASFADPWNAELENLNSWQSLRILSDLLAAQPRPYFYAGLSGGPAGPFDVLVDPRREEPVLVGQTKVTNGIQSYDVWASLPSSQSGESISGDFEPVSYAVKTTIREDRSLEGETAIKIRGIQSGERTLSLHLARELLVDQVVQQGADGAAHPLTFFQSPEFASHGASRSGGGDFLVVLDQPAVAGREYELHIMYRGTVISDAGNGVLFVAERGSWYASIPGPDRFVPFDLTFHWPRQLTLVATGKQVEENSEGEMRTGHWITTQPVSVAGFNLGEYVRQTVKSGGIQVDVYANRQLEDAIAERIRAEGATISEFMGNAPTPPEFDSAGLAPAIAPASNLPNPSATLSVLGGKILASIGFLEKWNGPFPFERLAIAQIPGSFGQGWPGLVYLPTLAFLPAPAQQQVGVTPLVQEQLSQLVPFHEVAHQWWGNTVGVESYRDTWILEAMANYLALMYSDSRQPGASVLEKWLESFRQQLTAAVPGSNETMESIGPLSLGYRLQSPQTPNAYDAILYGKGTWVIHMLRMMLRDNSARPPDKPAEISTNASGGHDSASRPEQGRSTQNPDERFVAVLRDLLEQHRFQPISTADFEHAVEHHMTAAMDLQGGRRMDWFFDEWVSQTGLPEYHVEFHSHIVNGRVQIRGTLFQDGVPAAFTLPVPLYAVSARSSGAPVGNQGENKNDDNQIGDVSGNGEGNRSQTGTNGKTGTTGKLVFLGTVITTGPETRFQFVLPAVAGFGIATHPSGLRISIDPRHTLLSFTK
jgi:hypothetical protein